MVKLILFNAELRFSFLFSVVFFILATGFAPTFCTKLKIVSADSSRLKRFNGRFTGKFVVLFFRGVEYT